MHMRLLVGMIAVFALFSAVVSADQQQQHFEVPARDSAKTEELANQLAGLSRRVDPNEAKLLAECAYATVARVQHVWHPDLQQFPCLSWLEETRLLLSLDRGSASCAG